MWDRLETEYGSKKADGHRVEHNQLGKMEWGSWAINRVVWGVVNSN